MKRRGYLLTCVCETLRRRSALLSSPPSRPVGSGIRLGGDQITGLSEGHLSFISPAWPEGALLTSLMYLASIIRANWTNRSSFFFFPFLSFPPLGSSEIRCVLLTCYMPSARERNISPTLIHFPCPRESPLWSLSAILASQLLSAPRKERKKRRGEGKGREEGVWRYHEYK